MTSLHEYQAAFAADLHAGQAQTVLPHLVHGSRDAAFDPFRIYVNHRRHTLVDALRAIYPATEALLGRAYFAQLATAFAPHHPSRSADLNAYGREFPAWLSELTSQLEHPLAAYPYIGQVATFEGLAHRAHHAPFDELEPPSPRVPLGTQRLTEVAERAAHIDLGLPPHAGLLRSDWDVQALRAYALGPSNHPAPSTAASEPQWWLVWRRDLTVMQAKVDPGIAALLTAAEAGSSLEQAIVRCSEAAPLTDPGSALAFAIEQQLLWVEVAP